MTESKAVVTVEGEKSHEAKVTISTAEAQQIFGRIDSCKEQVDTAYYQIGLDLGLVRENKLWESEYKSFEECLSQRWNFRLRKADYLMASARKLKQLDMPADTGASVGWTKMSQITRIAQTKEDVQEWLDKANEMSAAELTAEISNTLRSRDSDGKAEKIYRKTFGLYEGQHNVVTMALETAKQLSSSDKDNHGLDLICTHFLATYDEHETANISSDLDKGLRMLEARFGVKIVAMTDDGIVYGEDHVADKAPVVEPAKKVVKKPEEKPKLETTEETIEIPDGVPEDFDKPKDDGEKKAEGTGGSSIEW